MIFALSVLPPPVRLPAGLPAMPAPEQFWALLVWVIVPSVLVIWVNYYRQQESLRQVHRRLRQLEARLAASRPATTTAPLARPAAAAARPSSLTARLLLPVTAAVPSPFGRPLPGSGH